MERLESTWREMHRIKRAENQRPENQLRDPKENLKGKRSNSKHLRQDSLPERRRGRGVKRNPTLRYNYTLKKFSSRLNNGQLRTIKGAPMVGRGSDTNLSRPICDPIQKELEGPTKDRPAYWNAFARWISLHQHYIIDGDTYKRHTMPQEYNIILQEQHPTMDETQTETQTASTLLAQAANLEPIP